MPTPVPIAYSDLQTWVQTTDDEQKAFLLFSNPTGRPAILTSLHVTAALSSRLSQPQFIDGTAETTQKDFTATERGLAFNVEEVIDAPGGAGTSEAQYEQVQDGANLLVDPKPLVDFRLRTEGESSLLVRRRQFPVLMALVLVETGGPPNPLNLYNTLPVGNFVYYPSQNLLGLGNAWLEADVGGFRGTWDWHWSLKENNPAPRNVRFEEDSALYLIVNVQDTLVTNSLTVTSRGLVIT